MPREDRTVECVPPFPWPDTAVLKSIVAVLIAISLVVTLLVLFSGIFNMFRGSEFNRRYGNHMMRARVISQGITILLLIVYFSFFRD